jgi:hypothetical protein
MKSAVPGSHTITLFIIIGLCMVITGCSERFASYDILVSKFDAEGQNVWSTKIGSEKQDIATAIIETSDNGYVVAGGIADTPGGTTYPRIIKLNQTGGILWDRTLDAPDSQAIAIAQSQDGEFVVAQYIANLNAGMVSKIDNDGRPVWNRTFDFTIHDMIPTRNGGYALAGGHTSELDRNGTPVWDLPYTSTSIIQAADGGFFAENSYPPQNREVGNTRGSLLHLDANGTWVWTQPVGSHAMGKITSLRETPEGMIEIVYTYWDTTNDNVESKQVSFGVESEQLSFGKDGTPSATQSLVAVDPLTRTSDGGYAFMAYSFPGSAAFTTLPHTDSTLHIVRLSPQGAIVWDRSLDLGSMAAPESILQTRDGGFVTLVLLGS